MVEDDYYVSIDTGGTFTDGYVSYPDGSTTVKVPTTDHDLTVCFRNCIDKAAAKLEKPTEEFLVNTDVIRFSTTIGTNTIIERSGPKIGLIVTAGEEDGLFSAEAEDESLIAGEDLVIGVEERTDADGEVVDPVDADEVQAAAKTLMNRGAKLLLISFANSFHDETNEERARTVIETEYPPHYLGPNQVLTANEVSSRPGYRTRTYTALVNAYVHRPMARSLYKAEDDARNSGYSNPLLIGQSTGGVAGVSKTVALHTYNSGPVAGVLGADAFRELYDLESVLSADMGGTSIDLGTIVDGELERNLLPEVADMPVHVPMIDVHTAGAGGGSVASVSDGELSVGPESAGAEPGPACYDLGGFQPTTTDADVALGYIDPDYFLGGDQQLNADRAAEAIERQVADPLDVSVAEAALRVRQRVDGNIADSIETQLAERGEDPADVTLIAYGGAGPTHCCTFAEAAGITRIITAPAAAEFSAFGGATLDVEHRYSEALGETVAGDVPSVDEHAFERTIERLEAEAIQDMAGEGFDADEVALQTSILARLGDEIREVDVPSRIDDSSDLDPVIDAFDADPEDEIDLDTLVLTAVGPVATEDLDRHELGDADPSDARKGSREAYWPGDGWVETDVYQREDLVPGNAVEGRALIEATDTTYVVPDDWTYTIDEYANGIIER
ncbi:hydantoinase/oxoprolinase family protein [Halopenitus persicus]|uniref:N-methylhydantoinase A/acetophenone carboxylase n=1 Tax=Halopenitus persicus TaxID=1048396 RepID=A0A1H3EIW7_9EURY|nr:hydantoinase/oxoprolinase family protein [Halopenitus persicus]QHS17583.1 hydantoinase/oxoprolinase family protein [haloarchaeon 3A1-DGR]SDX78702.1 N-methylhydantoinase A/acetophenone carboxylase [Halopenitus persicus]